MSIASEITRLQGVKSDILTAIADKGVTVPSGSALADCPNLIGSISTGGDIVLPRTYTRIEYIHQSGDDGITANSTGYYQIDLGNDFTNENKKFGIIAKRDSEAYQSAASNCLLFQISHREYYDIEGITAQLCNPYSNVDTITWYNGGNQQREDAITHDGTPKITKVEISGTNCYIKSSIYSHEFTNGYYTKISTTTSNHYSLRLFGTFISAMGVNPTPARNVNALKGNIYAMYINDGNNTIHYYVPCRRNSDSVIGFYDVIVGEFYEPLGNTSALTAGPDLQTLETSRVNTITAINSKGVTVPSTAEFTDFAGYINQIPTGGGSDEPPTGYKRLMYMEYKRVGTSYWLFESIRDMKSSDKYHFVFDITTSTKGRSCTTCELRPDSQGTIYLQIDSKTNDTVDVSAGRTYGGIVTINVPKGPLNVDFIDPGTVNINSQQYPCGNGTISNGYFDDFLSDGTFPCFNDGTKFYGLTIYDSADTLKHKIVPVLRIDNSQVTLCDLVTGNLANKVCTNWIAGPDYH